MTFTYVSTRGQAPALGFSDVLLTGLARDGGLYVPSEWPVLDAETIAGFAGRSYADVAEEVIAPFTGDAFAPGELRAMVDEAYATFRHPAVAPLVQTGTNGFILELFHGPTLAFKDVAMQLLARMMDHALAKRGERATIVAATSGDTGGAAIEAFRSSERVDVVVLFPHGRVSDVQRRQMTTVDAPNVHAVAVEGNFDDCQAHVKALFNDHRFRDGMKLAAVNSINWARIVAQVVYYFTAAVALGAPHRPVSFVVPTGNFGDVFAGWVAKRMGLPIERLIVATNSNDILARTIETGRYEVQGVHPTSSPSMDIQVSSNFERLLFEAEGRDADAVRRHMDSLRQSGAFTLSGPVLTTIRGEFDAGCTDEDATARTLRETLADAGYLADPHTAVALAQAGRASSDPQVPVVVLATAHPAKFPDAVVAATGRHPPLPEHLAHLLSGQERMTVVPNDVEAIKAFIQQHSRAGGEVFA
jgi:threonine synthase